ncbi:MAG: alpha/beta fold hydrolase, partial [Phycisphaerales bacterium]|nr:alpha/beta fold hydrolase [Phycisphaerales bacterium]
HGRTAHKELDPGRYLRLARAGFASCAVDLPGHGERKEEPTDPAAALGIIEQMLGELDDVVQDLGRLGGFDMERAAIGGMSLGGMITLTRLCRPHPFRAAIVEAASGNWAFQEDRQFHDQQAAADLDPIRHLENWREIPLLAVHSRADQWVLWEGQREFLEALRRRSRDPGRIEELVFDRTGATFEHLGFGHAANEVRLTEIDFLDRALRAGQA